MVDLYELIGDFQTKDYIGRQAFTCYDHPRIGARKAMEDHGMRPPHVFGIGEIFRFPDSTDIAKRNTGGTGGWAIYYEFTDNDDYIGVCVFGSHHNDFDTVKWCNKNPDFMTTIERNQFNDRITVANKLIEKEREEKQNKAKEECISIWEKHNVLSGSPYTTKKKIKPYGAKTNGTAIILAIRDKDGIVSLQYIDDAGDKKLHTGGRKKGCWIKIDGEPDTDNIFICEGWSTGCSIREATGGHVYVAIDAGNIYEVTGYVVKNETGRITICADDDYSNAINTGLDSAKKAAAAHNVNVVMPDFKDHKDRGTDFNDMASLFGLDAVKEILIPAIKVIVKDNPDINKTEIKSDFNPPKGVLSDIVSFYNATSGNKQEGFAIQTAIALMSVMCGRYFTTDQDNMSSIYLLNVGKSATGKEHCKRVFERVLSDTGFDNRIAGDGFTSGAAVYSMLIQKPCCGVVIDEFGKYLEAASEIKGGMQKEANTTLMEAISRPDGILRPKNYSSMTLSSEIAKEMQNKFISYPALTLLGLTTPSTFFEQIKMSSVLDGFLNRFLVYVSDAKREPRQRTSMFDTPSSVKEWAKDIRRIITKNNSLETAQEKPVLQRLFFNKDAVEIQQAFEIEMIALQDKLEAVKLEALAGRSNEWAMRLALCSALSRNAYAQFIDAIDMQWSVNYVRRSTYTLFEQVRDNVSESIVESGKKEILQAIREFNEGISWREMQMRNPFMKHKTSILKETLQSLMDAELIEVRNTSEGRKGRPTTLYYAVQR